MKIYLQLRGTRGSQLLEFALALPFLAVLVVGIVDFGQAYNLKQIMTNAAREGARITVSNPLGDSSCPSGWSFTSPGNGTPCSIQAAANAVQVYLTNAGLSAASCITPASGTYSSPMTWTWSCNNVTLIIDKGYVVTGGAGGVVSSTKVTLSYPYTFTFGNVIGMLVPGATGPVGMKILSTNVVMQNLVLG